MDDRLVFDSRYTVGIDEIDREHEVLFLVTEKLYDALAVDVTVPMSEIHAAVSDLVRRTDEHFRSEEGLMARAAYPELEIHRRAHHELVKQVQKLEAEIAAGELRTPVDLFDFLCAWLSNHILSHDKALAAYLAREGIPKTAHAA